MYIKYKECIVNTDNVFDINILSLEKKEDGMTHKDMSLYFFLYCVAMFLLVFGVPIGILFLTHYSILLTITSFCFCVILGMYITIRIVTKILSDVHKETSNLIEKIKK